MGIAAQTEATLISVLESNLACVQNGSLYQLGGSLPCLESAMFSSQPLVESERGNGLLQERTSERIFML